MELPKAIILNNYSDYLKGLEVDAVLSEFHSVEKGVHVMAFHNSIAVNSDIAVPKEKQSQYIGIEGVITHVASSDTNSRQVKVIKI